MKITDLSIVISRAMDYAGESITISDATLPDYPPIYANTGFLRMSGYSMEEITGKNCHYLQGKDTDQATVKKIHDAIHSQQPVQVELLNYRKRGTFLEFFIHHTCS